MENPGLSTADDIIFEVRGWGSELGVRLKEALEVSTAGERHLKVRG